MPLTRRGFLKVAMTAPAVASFASAVPDFLLRTCAAAESQRGDRVLVIVQLTGGNDGLNTLVPFADDAYGRDRPTLRLPEKELHKIDADLAFHPRMEAFQRLYKQGRLSVIQGVGAPNHSGDHDIAMRMWHTAELEPTGRQTGWLGRTADSLPVSTNVPIAFVSSVSRPFALNAENAIIPTVRTFDDLTIRPLGALLNPVTGDSDGGDPLLEMLHRRQESSRLVSERIGAVAKETGGGDYPAFKLAANFRTISQLIRADVGIRIFLTELGGDGFGGFDNHANQIGNHCALLNQLAESTAAFVDDLAKRKLLDNVLMMTFSEFGRTVRENGRRGTDHGAAAPVFLAGGKLKGGLIGEHPSLTDLINGGLKFRLDFRGLYAAVLDQWLGIDSEPILGARLAPVDMLAT
jgi:uncharacterized protein (DUF1501 family)